MINLISRVFRRLLSAYYCLKYKKCFKTFGHNVRIYSPLKIQGNRSIILGDNVRLGDGTWLASMQHTELIPQLILGNNVLIGHYNHIYCTSSIIIEDDVLTADKVYISDNTHEFEDINTPIWRQPIRQLSPVIIGEGSWLGEHVCVLGASIGKHCVIGANSVVIHSIPDYCVAVGSPAKVIKRYNFNTQMWELTK